MLREERTVDPNTGEVLDQKITRTTVVQQDKFIQVYLEDLSGFLKLQNGTQIGVLALIWKHCNYSTDLEQWNKIAILKEMKTAWAKELNCSIKTIDNTLTALVNKGLLTRADCRGLYVLNPKYFFKGTSSMRQVILNIENKYKFVEEINEKETANVTFND